MNSEKGGGVQDEWVQMNSEKGGGVHDERVDWNHLRRERWVGCFGVKETQ
jgi:hypothetical protein